MRDSLDEEKIIAEIRKLNAEARKLVAEEEKIKRDRWLNPLILGGSLIGALASLIKLWIH